MGAIVDFIRNHPEQVNALAAVSALFVSLLSIILTVWAMSLQRQHNFKSLTPIASLGYWDYEDRLLITLKNSGVGPLRLEDVIVSRGGEEKHNIIGWMPHDITYSDFTSRLQGICISPEHEIVLLEFRGDPRDANFVLSRDKVRRELMSLNVSVRYKDIYDRQMPDENESLDWFGRHLALEGKQQARLKPH